ncbi:hypothetical protein D3C75_1023030 [compost metagenome]
MVHHAQRRQRLVAGDAALFLGDRAVVGVQYRAVAPVGIDVLEAHARGNGPVAHVDLVVDVVSAGLGAAAAVLEHVAVGSRGHRRHVVDQRQASRLFAHRFLQVTVTDTDFLGGWAGKEDARHTGFDGKGVVVARVRRQRLHVPRGDGAAAEAVGVVGQHFELGGIVELPLPL